MDRQTNLVTYYRFDEMNGIQAPDVAQIQPGTLFGSTYVTSRAPVTKRGFAIQSTDKDDDIRIWWDIDEHHQEDPNCAFATPGCKHLDFLNVTINGEVFETEYTPRNDTETIFVFAGNGNDRVVMTPEAAQHWNAEFYGEEGDDTLIGARHRFGGDRGGKDRLFGGPGDDTLQGGEGNDRLHGGPGADVIIPFDDLDITGKTTSLWVHSDDEDIISTGIIAWVPIGTRELDGFSYDLYRRPPSASTYFGDANLDGKFDTTDIVQVFQAGEFEDSIVGNSTWAIKTLSWRHTSTATWHTWKSIAHARDIAATFVDL